MWFPAAEGDVVGGVETSLSCNLEPTAEARLSVLCGVGKVWGVDRAG